MLSHTSCDLVAICIIASKNLMAAQTALYSYFRSTCSWRVRIALALKNVEYEYKPIHLLKDGGEQHSEEYKKLNPRATVPTLIIDSHSLTDSVAIMEYLEESRKEGTSLLPGDAAQRAKIRSLVQVITSGTQPIQNLAVLQYISNEENRLDKMVWGKHWIATGLTAFENMVCSTAGQYCVGDSLSMADVCLIPQLYNAGRFQVDMSNYPTINRIAENCNKLEAFKVAHPHIQPDCIEELRGK